MAEKIVKGEREWRAALAPEEFRVKRERATEPPFTGRYWNCHEAGIYRCVCCGAPLFAAETKFDSGTGWPSFWAPADAEGVALEDDDSHGMRRVEVKCALRRSSRPLVSRRTPSDRTAVLHQFGGAAAGVQAGGGGRKGAGRVSRAPGTVPAASRS